MASSKASTDASKPKNVKVEHSPFGQYEMVSTSPHTAMVLLRTSEPGILFKTYEAITKFIRQTGQNIVTLDKLGVIRLSIPHIEHTDLRVKRLALRFNANMIVNNDVLEEVLAVEGCMATLARILTKAEDVFVLEYCSLCLARLTTHEEGCVQLMELDLLNVLFKRMRESTDPDVQMNSLQTLDNLLKTTTASKVTKNQYFNWPVILYLAQSKYIQLQDTALQMTLDLLLRYDDDIIQNKFKECSGLNDLMKILKDYYFRDVHHKVLNIFSHYVLRETNAYHFYEMKCLPDIDKYLKLCKVEMKPYLLGMLESMARTWLGKHIMYDIEMDMVFIEYLDNIDCLDILTHAVKGIANMTQLIVSSVRMFNAGVVPLLCQLLGDETLPWNQTRLSVLRVLTQLSRIIRDAAANLVVQDTFYSLRVINRNYLSYPIPAQHMALECFINLLTFHIQDGSMKNKEFMEEILMIIRNLDEVLSSKTCKLISTLARDEEGKQLFSVNKGEKVITDFLKNGNRKYRGAVCQLIVSTCSESTAEAYHALGTIEYMWFNREGRYTIPNWEMALHKLMDCHLSSKFAFTGTLGITDITKDGFYVLKRLRPSFPTIQALRKQKPSYEQVAYYVCGFHKTIDDPYKEMLRMISENNVKFTRKSSSLKKLSVSQLNVDANLKFYLSKLQRWFGQPAESVQVMNIGDSYEVRYREKCNEISPSIKHKADILADFVVAQMSAMTPEDDKDCTTNSVELHLADLMTDYKTSVLKLGLIRLGGQLERSVLYKVLADRVGIPCSITRTKWGHAWCEVAVPEPETKKDMEINYPTDHITLNYVVNLYDNSELRLHLKESAGASKITGPPDAPKYTVGTCDK